MTYRYIYFQLTIFHWNNYDYIYILKEINILNKIKILLKSLFYRNSHPSVQLSYETWRKNNQSHQGPLTMGFSR